MSNNLIKVVTDSLKGPNILPKSVLNINGYTSDKVKYFLNNLIHNIGDARYLEIGMFKGATFVAALFNNKFEYAIGIDNSSEFGDVTAEREANVDKFLVKNNMELISDDCFTVNLSDKKFNIYFYDGNHFYDSQKKAFTYFDSVLDDEFIAVVDDWNWDYVRKGTLDAFSELGYIIVGSWELISSKEGDPNSWWNGLGVFVIKKKV